MIATQTHKAAGNIRHTYSSGDKYGCVMLTGKSYLTEDSMRIVECICECETIFWTRLSGLKNGHTKSCGCFHKKKVSQTFTKHGLSAHPIYSVWEHMKDRCYNENFKQFDDYGGRGIKICDEWLHNPKAFIEWALNNGWENGLTVERKNNNKDYSPENCTFVTQAIQSRNKRSNVLITAFGETKCIADWIKDERCIVSFNTLNYRVKKLGFNPELAMVTKSLRGRRILKNICSN